MGYKAFIEQAVEYLTAERKINRSDRYDKVLAGPVADKLIDFCREEGELAQAVVQTKNFSDCLKAVRKDAGAALSDVEAYGRAVAFYFPGAKVRCVMTVDLVGDAASASNGQNPKRLQLSLADIL